MFFSSRTAALVGIALTGVVALQIAPAQAQATIRNATVVSNTGGEYSSTYSINNTVNQSGLSTGYTSGVTLFDTYIASNPTHSLAGPSEWFSPLGVHSSIITYDLGALYSLNKIALWNEEVSGITSMTVTTAADASFAVSTSIGTFTPTNSTPNQDYAAQVFSFGATDARYVRLSVTGPKPNAGFDGTAIGEVAFSTSPTAAVVPEATAVSLLGFALPMVGGVIVRRRLRLRQA